MLPEDHVQLHVYTVDSHRLALWLDSQKRLAPLIRACILGEMGFKSGNVRLQNLL